MKKYLYTSLLALLVTAAGYSQHNNQPHLVHTDHLAYPHFRVAALIGHTLIPAEHAGKNFFIPSWGLDVEYWIVEKFGLGIHSDLEIETFVIIGETETDVDLERLSPLVVTLDVLFRPWKGLILQLGPGVEFETSENFSLIRAGLEYEIELTNNWDLAPTVFFDRRFSEYHTWSFALGVGKRF
jgi:hypothetical protein